MGWPNGHLIVGIKKRRRVATFLLNLTIASQNAGDICEGEDNDHSAEYLEHDVWNENFAKDA